MFNLAAKKCIPCEAGTPSFSKTEAGKYLNEVHGWELVEDDEKLKIRKRFKFNSYLKGIEFVAKVAKIAEVEGHHPDMFVGYQKVTVNLITHAIGGLSENDFIMAEKIDKITP